MKIKIHHIHVQTFVCVCKPLWTFFLFPNYQNLSYVHSSVCEHMSCTCNQITVHAVLFLLLNSVSIIWSGKLKLCREERGRIIREKNAVSTVNNEERKHFSSSPRHQGWNLIDDCLIFYRKVDTCLQLFQVDLKI